MRAKQITIYVPAGHQVRSVTERAWDTIRETLVTNTWSDALDSKLRDEIRAAIHAASPPRKVAEPGLVAYSLKPGRDRQLLAAPESAWIVIDRTLQIDAYEPTIAASRRRDIERSYFNMRSCVPVARRRHVARLPLQKAS